MTGGQAPHTVTQNAQGTWHCDCLDHTRVRRCKHVIATLLHLGDEDTLRNAEVLADDLDPQETP